MSSEDSSISHGDSSAEESNENKQGLLDIDYAFNLAGVHGVEHESDEEETSNTSGLLNP